MRKRIQAIGAVCLSLLFVSVSVLSAQVCTLSVTGVNRYRYVMGPVAVECGNDIHSAPFGNWGVTSTVGKKQDGHQFDGWCHDSWVCDNYGNCKTKCRDGWYEWNSCTDHPQFAAPNCTLYNAASCTAQYTTQDIDVHGTSYLNLATTCPFDSDGDRICDTGGCSALSAYTQASHFMSLYELDTWATDDLVQTLYFPEMTVPLTCNAWGCGIAGSQWVSPAYYQNPSWPPKAYNEAAIVVGWGSFSDPNRVCRNYASKDPRYNCY
jgi:hypothetical protein